METLPSANVAPPPRLRKTPRYELSQINRTLLHPNLIQPTVEEEEIHKQTIVKFHDESMLMCGLCDPKPEQSIEDVLIKHLSEAFQAGSQNLATMHAENDNGHDSLPTSTLNVPESSSLAQHASLNGPRRTEIDRHTAQHSFVVCADSQIGMTSQNEEWETELNYCRQAIRRINALHPRPKFVSVCGDLIDMEYTFHQKPNAKFSKKACDEIQDKQNEDFKRCWESLHDDIAVLCICGNHDIGNRPTKASIEKFKSAFGDDYLAFWVNGTYNIVLNNVLFSDPSGAPELFDKQLKWLEERLSYAKSEHNAAAIFVFAHHPFFLYHEDEEAEDLVNGSSSLPPEWNPAPGAKGFPDSYFSITKEYRMLALNLFKEYGVSACFVGHFHQNLLSRTSWGMEHIITAPLSMVFDSSGKPTQPEVNDRGMRIVDVNVDLEYGDATSFSHRFETL